MKLGGDITVSELVEGYEKIFSNEDFRTNMHAIWNLSGLDLKKFPVNQVRQLPDQLSVFMERRGQYKAALVTSRAIDYHLLRLYLSILKLIGSNIRFRLFRSLDEAYVWVEQ